MIMNYEVPQVTNYMQWESQGCGKFLTTNHNIPRGINRLVLIKDSPTEYRIRAFIRTGDHWKSSLFPGIEWQRHTTYKTGGDRWDAEISKKQYETIKNEGQI